MNIEDFDQIAEAHKVHSRRILENIGITINLTEMSEHKEYAEYYLNRNWLVRWYLRIFKWANVKELQFNVQVALLNEILERGQELIE